MRKNLPNTINQYYILFEKGISSISINIGSDPNLESLAKKLREADMFKKRWFVPLVSTLIVLVVIVTVASIVFRSTSGSPSRSASTSVPCNSTRSAAASPALPICHKRILVFSKTAAFRHASIADGKQVLKKLADAHGFAIDFSEDANVFSDSNLARYNAVVFLMTTGEIFNDSQQIAFQHYIEAGGGFVGIHSASDTEYDWPWYGGLVGAYNNVSNKHSSVQPATVHVEDSTTPSTNMLPALWMRTDEWYNFAVNPRSKVHVLLTVDEKTYKGGIMGTDHPLAWYHAYDGGRAWYTAMGHTSESYHEPLFQQHLWGGILYAVGLWQKSTGNIANLSYGLPSPALTTSITADTKNIYSRCCCCSC